MEESKFNKQLAARRKVKQNKSKGRGTEDLDQLHRNTAMDANWFGDAAGKSGYVNGDKPKYRKGSK